jgi:hypothetical protein
MNRHADADIDTGHAETHRHAQTRADIDTQTHIEHETSRHTDVDRGHTHAHTDAQTHTYRRTPTHMTSNIADCVWIHSENCCIGFSSTPAGGTPSSQCSRPIINMDVNEVY